MKTTISCLQPIGDAAAQLCKLTGDTMSYVDARGILQAAVVRRSYHHRGLFVGLGSEDDEFSVIIGEG